MPLIQVAMPETSDSRPSETPGMSRDAVNMTALVSKSWTSLPPLVERRRRSSTTKSVTRRGSSITSPTGTCTLSHTESRADRRAHTPALGDQTRPVRPGTPRRFRQEWVEELKHSQASPGTDSSAAQSSWRCESDSIRSRSKNPRSNIHWFLVKTISSVTAS